MSGHAEDLEISERPDEPLDGVQGVLEPICRWAGGGNGDPGTLEEVLVVGLGHREREPVAKAVDEWAERRPFVLERLAGTDAEVGHEDRSVDGH